MPFSVCEPAHAHVLYQEFNPGYDLPGGISSRMSVPFSPRHFTAIPPPHPLHFNRIHCAIATLHLPAFDRFQHIGMHDGRHIDVSKLIAKHPKCALSHARHSHVHRVCLQHGHRCAAARPV